MFYEHKKTVISHSESTMNGPVGSLCQAPDILTHAPERRCHLVLTCVSTCVSCDHLRTSLTFSLFLYINSFNFQCKIHFHYFSALLHKDISLYSLLGSYSFVSLLKITELHFFLPTIWKSVGVFFSFTVCLCQTSN